MACHLTLFLAYFSVNFSRFYIQNREVWEHCLWFWDICNVFYIWVCNSIILET